MSRGIVIPHCVIHTPEACGSSSGLLESELSESSLMAASRSSGGGGGGDDVTASRGSSSVLALLTDGPKLPSLELSLMLRTPTSDTGCGSDTLCLEPDRLLTDGVGDSLCRGGEADDDLVSGVCTSDGSDFDPAIVLLGDDVVIRNRSTSSRSPSAKSIRCIDSSIDSAGVPASRSR